jgi:hypothetical protein
VQIFKFLARRNYEDMPIISAADFNVNVKGNYNADDILNSFKATATNTIFLDVLQERVSGALF